METIEQIMIDEGYREAVYLCPAGKLTWLFGRNIDDRPITTIEWILLRIMLSKGKTMRQWAAQLLMIEADSLIDGFRRDGVILRRLPGEVSCILINMGYNMGLSKFNPRKWPNFFKAIEGRDWKQAAIEGRDSKWWRVDVRTRADRLMKALENVEFD